MERLPNELLVMVCELILAFDQPIQTCYPVTPSRCGGRWPPPYWKKTKHIRRRDLAIFSVSKRIRNVALDVFWRRNTFLYFPESKKDRRRAIAFLSSQAPSTRELVRKFRVHFFLERAYWPTQPEELCARLQPLEWIVRRLDRSVKRQVDIYFWRSETIRKLCRYGQLMILAGLKHRGWRLRSLRESINGFVAERWQCHRMCRQHAVFKDAIECAW